MKTKKILLALLALLCLGISYNVFLIGNDLNLGGFTGIAQICARFDIDYTFTLIALNIIPFGFAFVKRQKGLFIGSLIMTTAFGLTLDLAPEIELHAIPTSLSLMVGSVLAGGGFGLICRIGASTGGSDMLAMTLVRVLKKLRLSVGQWMTVIDGMVIIAWCLIVRSSFIESISAMLLCNIAVDVVIFWGENRKRAKNLILKTQSLLISNRERITNALVLVKTATLLLGKNFPKTKSTNAVIFTEVVIDGERYEISIRSYSLPN